MKKQIYIVTALLSLLLTGVLPEVALAAENTAITGNPPLLPQTDLAKESAVQKGFSSPNTQLVHALCPPVDTLVRDPKTQTWAAPNGWKTTSPSFLRSVDNFAGAQWVGISIGEVICVYTKTGRSTFPVTLQRGKLVPAPTSGGLWSEDKGGYMECKSNDIRLCPFFTQIPKKEQNVYEQLDFHKGKPVESND